MTEEEKEPYELDSQKDKQRKERQEKELEEKGYFTLEDGTKSTDCPVPVKNKIKSNKSGAKPKEDADQPVVKRGRGRPRLSDPEKFVKSLVVGAKRGRPKKDKSGKPLLDKDEMTQVVSDVKNAIKSNVSKGRAQKSAKAKPGDIDEHA